MGEMDADLATDVTVAEDRQTPLRTWAICGLMLLATMLNYMDRQTLAQQATEIRGELRLSNERLWLARNRFRPGVRRRRDLVTGTIADRVSLRVALPGHPAGLVGRRLRDRLGNELHRALSLPGHAGFLRGRAVALCAGGLATAAAARPATPGQQHPPERGLAGRDRDAPDHSPLEHRRTGRLAAAVSGRGRSGPGLGLRLADGDSTARPGDRPGRPLPAPIADASDASGRRLDRDRPGGYSRSAGSWPWSWS